MDYKYLLDEVKENGIVDIIARRLHEMKYMGVMNQLIGDYKPRTYHDYRYTSNDGYHHEVFERLREIFGQLATTIERCVHLGKNQVRSGFYTTERKIHSDSNIKKIHFVYSRHVDEEENLVYISRKTHIIGEPGMLRGPENTYYI